ncbi:MAG: DUF4157 domain-containing protein [Bacteroidota bacterium]
MKLPYRESKDKNHRSLDIAPEKPGNAGTIEDNRPTTAKNREIAAVIQRQEKSAPLADLRTNRSNAGLPDQLKTGIENLSGFSMDDVKVHYNSSKPAQLQAHAYAQGTNIHLGPGQEKHLPHEAWHVVQQKQGRVKPTLQFKKGVNFNDDASLEREADVMGNKAAMDRLSVGSEQRQLNSSVYNTGNEVIQGRIYTNAPNRRKSRIRKRKYFRTRMNNLLPDYRDNTAFQKYIEDVWDYYGSSKGNHIHINEVAGGWERSENAFEYLSGGGLLGSVEETEQPQMRNEVQTKFDSKNTDREVQAINQLITPIRTRLLAMIPDLMVTWYGKATSREEIQEVGELQSAEYRERQAKAKSADAVVEANIIEQDKNHFRNTGYVFGFLEHKQGRGKWWSKFAGGKDSEGMRVSRDLRWVLRQPGVVIEGDDLLAAGSDVPGVFIGLNVPNDKTQPVSLRQYSNLRNKPQEMMEELIQYITMRIWRSLYFYDLEEEDITKRGTQVEAIIKKLGELDNPEFIKSMQLAFGGVQILIPWSVGIGPEFGDSRIEAQPEDYVRPNLSPQELAEWRLEEDEPEDPIPEDQTVLRFGDLRPADQESIIAQINTFSLYKADEYVRKVIQDAKANSLDIDDIVAQLSNCLISKTNDSDIDSESGSGDYSFERIYMNS